MTDNRLVFVPLKIRPRHDSGTDWGSQQRVLAETHNSQIRLQIVGGHTAPVGAWGFGRRYHSATLWLVGRKVPGFSYRMDDRLAEGRISLAKILEFREKIDDTFGCPGLVDKINFKHTVIVTPAPQV